MTTPITYVRNPDRDQHGPHVEIDPDAIVAASGLLARVEALEKAGLPPGIGRAPVDADAVFGKALAVAAPSIGPDGVDASDAPEGYVAVLAPDGEVLSPCSVCALREMDECAISGCVTLDRKDGQSVVFVKKPAPAAPERRGDARPDAIVAASAMAGKFAALQADLTAAIKERDDYHRKACDLADWRDKLQADLAASQEKLRLAYEHADATKTALQDDLAAMTESRNRCCREADNHRRDLCEIAEGCGVGVSDPEEAKRRIVGIAAERDAARLELEAAVVANAGLAESLKQECAEHNATKGAAEGWKKMSDAARAGLAEAVGSIKNALATLGNVEDDDALRCVGILTRALRVADAKHGAAGAQGEPK